MGGVGGGGRGGGGWGGGGEGLREAAGLRGEELKRDLGEVMR